MADELNPKRTAIAVGTFAAAMHVIWAVVVAAGFAQGLIDWVTGLHFLNTAITVSAFDAVTASTLVATTFVVGAIVGWIFALSWNRSKKWK